MRRSSSARTRRSSASPPSAIERFCADVRAGTYPGERGDVPHDRSHGRGARPVRRRRPSPSSRSSRGVDARVRIAVAVVVLALASALAGVIVVVVRIRSDDERRRVTCGFAATTPAVAPFGEFSRGRGSRSAARCLRVLVAPTPAPARSRGCAAVRSLGPYAGMLFVQPGRQRPRASRWPGRRRRSTSRSSRRDGVPVDDARMTPCPQRHRRDVPRVREQGPVPLRTRAPGRLAEHVRRPRRCTA